MAKIGFVGLGHMGLPMAKNLIKATHNVRGYDLQKDALLVLQESGGEIAASIEELAHEQDFIITMLQTGQQVQSVCFGNTGLFANSAKNTLFIDCSTIDVNSSLEIHRKAKFYNLRTIDAPVSGGVAGANNKALTFMVGGSKENYDIAKPILSAMGQKIIHTGNASHGQAAKICNNMLLGISMIGVSEAFNLAASLGLSANKLHEVLSNSSGKCWVTDKYLPVANVIDGVPANNNYNPGFTTAMMLKDLRLSQECASKAKVTTKIAELATAIYQKAVENGKENLDFSAIIQEDYL